MRVLPRRMTAAENDEVVGIRDDVCTERLAASGPHSYGSIFSRGRNVLDRALF
jgi:hypothetical protein